MRLERVSAERCKNFGITGYGFIDPYKCSVASIKSDFIAATRYLNDMLQNAERFMFLSYIEG
jgi:hypothetical protein